MIDLRVLEVLLLNSYSRKSITVYCDNDTLKERILKTHPSTDGLYPHEIAMLIYTSYGTFTTKQRNYSGVWKFLYYVENPEALFFSLVSRGFIRECEDSELIDHLKMREIQRILKMRGMKVPKEKHDAISIVQSFLSGDEIFKILGYRYYILTATGRKAVERQTNIVNNPNRAWDLFIWDSSKPLINEAEFVSYNAANYNLFIDNQSLKGHLFASGCTHEEMLYRINDFSSPKNLSVYLNQKKVLYFENIDTFQLLSTSKKLIIGSFLEADKVKCTCYDLSNCQIYSIESLERVSYINGPHTEELNILNRMKGDTRDIIEGEKIHYYFSTNDGIAEVIAQEYLPRFGTVEKLPPLILNDTSNNFHVTIKNDNHEIQYIIMLMILDKHFSAPSVLGASVYSILHMLALSQTDSKILHEIVYDYWHIENIEDELETIKSTISKDFRTVLNYFLSFFPPQTLTYMPYQYYTSNKDPHFFYAANNRESCNMKLKRILLQLKEEGIINSRWINEFNLYLLVKSHFQDTIYQCRFKWLKQQSLDIFVPELNLGIEYQGEQHYKPVEIFGGDVGFEDTQKRDQKKKQLCRENNIRLIEWPYSLEINHINLKNLLKNEGIRLQQ